MSRPYATAYDNDNIYYDMIHDMGHVKLAEGGEYKGNMNTILNSLYSADI